MKGVCLVSGGIDSALMSLLIQNQGHEIIPIFIDYGQLAATREWKACETVFKKYNLPHPLYVNLSGYGNILKSGLTDASKDTFIDAFLPGRNMLLLTTGASISFQEHGNFVAIGLLSEKFSIFGDQRQRFISSFEDTIFRALGRRIKVVLPLFDFSKADVLLLSENMGIDIEDMYYCHRGEEMPCNECISCKERNGARASMHKKGE